MLQGSAAFAAWSLIDIKKMKKKPITDDRIRLEQIRQLFTQSPVATVAAIIVAIVVGIALTDTIKTPVIVTWVTATVFITLIRYGLVLKFKKTGADIVSAHRWKRLFIVLLVLSGFAWGSAGIFLFPSHSIAYQTLIYFVLVAMVAGALGTFSVVISAFLAYAIPALLPIIIRSFLFGDMIHLALCLLTLLFLVFTSITAYFLNRQTVTVLGLKFENLDLVQHLEKEKLKTESINRSLTEEVTERRRIAADLQRHKENLETLVRERTKELRHTNIELKKEINDRIRTESALKESEEKYRLLVENAGDAICILQDRRIQFHNERAESLLGIPGDILATKPYFDYIHPDDLKTVEELYFKRKSGEIIPPEHSIRMIHANGSEVWTQVNIIDLKWRNRPALLCFVRDVTRQKHLEMQLIQSQKMEAVGSLAGGIAHDINNILGGIQGNISMVLMAMAPDNPASQRIKDIESYIQSGASLTRQLLSFAQPEQPEIKTADINQLINNTVQMFCRTHKKIQVEMSCDNTLNIVAIDYGQMEQVLLNLLVNAWHSMPEGGTIYVGTRNIQLSDAEADAFRISPGPYVRISLTDTGTGIDKSVLPKIFEPFFTTKPKDKGTGLGLSTAYTIIKNHGGHITVYSKLGRGTTFNIYLPASEEQKFDLAPPEERIVSGTETILLVDDESDIREIGREMLEALGYAVISADSGERAIAEFSTDPDRIDLVVLDMIMPKMDGEEVYQRLRSIRPDVKILLSSGYSRSGQAARILEKGCNGFIQKPFNMQRLSIKVREILDEGQCR